MRLPSSLRAGRWRGLRDTSARSAVVLLAAIVAAAVAFTLARPDFLSRENAFNIAEQTAVISLVAFGMTVVIITRGIDLSVGSSLALAGVAGGLTLSATGSAPLTLLAVLGTALAVGALNGVLVAVLKVNPFMATLGTYALARGGAISLSGGASQPVDDPLILFLGQTTIAGAPAAAVVTLVALAACQALLRRTVLGRWLYATGGNPRAALASGIPTRLVTCSAYVLTGLLVGVGSLLVIGRVSSVQPLAGQGLEFSAITAAVIGGTSLAGGRGNVVATFLGSVFVGVVSSGLSFLGLDQSLIYILTGGLVVAAVLVSQPEILREVRDRWATARTALSNTLQRTRPGGAAADRAGGEHSLSVDGVGKTFPGVVALRSVSLQVRSGEVVALMGENGAGKSTLVKILSGSYRPSSGTLRVDGRPVRFAGPEDARRAGIAVIHQHFTLVPDLTVAENLFLGDEPRQRPLGLLHRRRMRQAAKRLLDDLDVPVPPDTQVGRLGVGHRQMIEIARSVREQAWLVIMDEPTSALSARERDHLYALIQRLRARGTAVLYISHKLDEIYHLAARAVVLRDGQVVGRPSLAEVTPDALVDLMVGRSIEHLFPYVTATTGEERLSVRNLSDGGVLRDATLTVRGGEVVGLVGLMGSGRTELIRCVAGLAPVASGQVRVLGRDPRGLSVGALTGLGVAYVPEDRLEEGVFPELTVGQNLSLLWVRANHATGVLRPGPEHALVRELVGSLDVRPAEPARQIRDLSGGNQQKVVLGRWLAMQPKLVLLDDPTRGVDIGAKAELHALVARLKTAGAAVLLTSSEMPEVLSVADRVVVLRGGRTVAEYPRGVAEEQVMRDAFGESAATGVPTEAGGADR